MQPYKNRYSYIENAYIKYRSVLLENDKYRPCKSITRDIFSTIDKFGNYYLLNNNVNLTANDILNCLNARELNDTTNTNIRVMRELGLLIIICKNSYVLTEEFVNLANSNMLSKNYFLDFIRKCDNISNYCMLFNTLICTLREGYLTGNIISFPESIDDFRRAVPNIDDRNKYCKMVNDIYGFHGRNRTIDSDSYTPNANYRILTVLKTLNLIEDNGTFDNMRCYKLTTDAFSLLDTINLNFKVMFKNSSEIEAIIGEIDICDDDSIICDNFPLDQEKIVDINEVDDEFNSDVADKIKNKNINKNNLLNDTVENSTYVYVKRRKRSSDVTSHTRIRANGICDLCGNKAPFDDKYGVPYLETHHLVTLASNGPDAIFNTVALCPNCHRKMHSLDLVDDREFLKKVIYNYLLNDEEKEALEKFEKLFNITK